MAPLIPERAAWYRDTGRSGSSTQHSSAVRNGCVSCLQLLQGAGWPEGVDRVLVSLDSNHTHEHVLAELNAYADLVSVDSYCIVFDTAIEDLPAGSFPDRPWDKGNNPKTAVHEWLNTHHEFKIDKDIDNKLLFSVAPDGYLKRVKD